MALPYPDPLASQTPLAASAIPEIAPVECLLWMQAKLPGCPEVRTGCLDPECGVVALGLKAEPWNLSHD